MPDSPVERVPEELRTSQRFCRAVYRTKTNNYVRALRLAGPDLAGGPSRTAGGPKLSNAPRALQLYMAHLRNKQAITSYNKDVPESV